MLTTDDREEIKRLVAEMMKPQPAASALRNYAEEIEQIDAMQNTDDRLSDLIVDYSLTEITLVNPRTGERLVVSVSPGPDSLVEVTARAIEVFGTREKALRWLRTPVRALGEHTPMSLLNSPEGLARVQDALGQVEHGVW